jgi:hypothetical protein
MFHLWQQKLLLAYKLCGGAKCLNQHLVGCTKGLDFFPGCDDRQGNWTSKPRKETKWLKKNLCLFGSMKDEIDLFS